jgi:hypothetical protein
MHVIRLAKSLRMGWGSGGTSMTAIGAPIGDVKITDALNISR